MLWITGCFGVVCYFYTSTVKMSTVQERGQFKVLLVAGLYGTFAWMAFQCSKLENDNNFVRSYVAVMGVISAVYAALTLLVWCLRRIIMILSWIESILSKYRD